MLSEVWSGQEKCVKDMPSYSDMPELSPTHKNPLLSVKTSNISFDGEPATGVRYVGAENK
jgi:hypothetical protein